MFHIFQDLNKAALQVDRLIQKCPRCENLLVRKSRFLGSAVEFQCPVCGIYIHLSSESNNLRVLLIDLGVLLLAALVVIIGILS